MSGGLWLRGGPQGGIYLPFLAEVRFADGRSETVLVGEHVAGESGAIVARGTSASFAAELLLEPPVGSPPRWDARLSARCTLSTDVEAAFLVEYRLGVTHDPHWLVPGLFYQANRWPDCARLYPRFTAEHPDPAQLESDTWAFRADRAATPAVFAWDDHAGAALVGQETSCLGENGIGFALREGRPHLRLHYPFREEPVVYDGSDRPRPPIVTTAVVRGGHTVDLAYSVYALSENRHIYADVLRQVTALRRQDEGRHGGRPPTAWVGVHEAADLAAWGLHRWHYRSDPPVLLETAAFDREALGERGDRPAMHVSWVSGTPYAYALLRYGRRRANGDYVRAACAVLDNVAANLAPGGTFWGQWQEGKGWGAGWTPDPDRLHSRTLADATLFMWRAVGSERALGTARPRWEKAVLSNLGAVVASQRRDGALGSAYAASDGSPIDWRGSAGLAWVAPLAEVGAAGAPELVSAAQRAGDYFAGFVESEYLCGAPEDVDLAPTSEDGYLAIMSYMALYRADGDRRWLELARRSADWMLTFRYTYDVSFPPKTLLGHYNFRTLGADQASPSNQHLHNFGLICLPEMAELSDALGDGYYRERARENLACFRQFVAREDGDFNAYRGMVSERFYQTTCFQAKGMLLTLSHAWCVGVLLLACEEAISSGQDWEEKWA